MKTTLELIGMAFLTGAGGWVATNMQGGPPSTAAQWKAAAIGAAMGGLVAVWQRFRPVPAQAKS